MWTEIALIDPTVANLARYGSVPSSFVVAGDRPYLKDYDALADHRPVDWPLRWDVAGWRVAVAGDHGAPAGGVAVIVRPAAADDPSGRTDGSVLWDLRVAPPYRRRGLGRRLLAFAERHVVAAGRQRLVIETQDVNVAACRFYAASGYTLEAADPFAYPDLPDEVRLVWSKAFTTGL